ncbi:hypothetical protein CSOJ01_06344 [Colletotrichum sojae]|uniref:Uncharacterized protein n=1 Tax=Colletotrichum sojae TaxID=2175907 RepID=A0A8H6JCI8_9PEZI|nr:hypothetical protein CSOJ01_06344 [Colletotrichum sojae]
MAVLPFQGQHSSVHLDRILGPRSGSRPNLLQFDIGRMTRAHQLGIQQVASPRPELNVRLRVGDDPSSPEGPGHSNFAIRKALDPFCNIRCHDEPMLVPDS